MLRCIRYPLNLFVIFSVLVVVFLSANSFAADPYVACCADKEIGCYEVFKPIDGEKCLDKGNQLSDVGYICSYNPLTPGAPIADFEMCRVEGCCCYDGKFNSDLTQVECNELDGTFSSGESNCAAACGIDIPEPDKTCEGQGGFWCKEIPATGVELTDVSDLNPLSGLKCSNVRCEEPPSDCSLDASLPGAGFEMVCSDGKDDDGNCFVDDADIACSNSVKGSIVDMIGNPVSSVKVEFLNLDHDADRSIYGGHVDKFSTYSFGVDGEFYFKGLSAGKYKATVVDSYYESTVGELEFSVSSSSMHHEPLEFVVVPRNSFEVVGVVKNKEGEPMSDVLVYIEDTQYSTLTDENGEYLIPYVAIPTGSALGRLRGSYRISAFMSDYELTTSYIDLSIVRARDSVEKNFELESALCSIRPGKPNLINLTMVKGTTDVNISFDSGACKAEDFFIYRCQGGICSDVLTDYFGKVAELSGDLREFIDDSPKNWGEDYTYYVVTSDYRDGSELMTINTGDAECEARKDYGSFCIYDVAYGINADNINSVTSSEGVFCDENNQVQTYVGSGGEVKCGSGSKCVEVDSGTSRATTYCKVLSECDPKPGNIFGLFFDKESCQGEDNTKSCVFDASSTNVDYCYSCNSYASCGDYRSESSCQENICGVGNCAWSITNSELNTGVCYDQQFAKCSECDSDYNDFFGFCDADTCKLMGDCAYSEIDYQCKGCEEISCYDYSNADDCNGGRTRLRIDYSTNKLFDAYSSADTCSIGACRWETDISGNERCYKDSDVNRADDCQELIDEVIIIPRKGSAFSSYTASLCMMDTVRPETSVIFDKRNFNPNEPINGKIRVDFKPVDRAGTSSAVYEVKETYFCITPKGSSGCSDTRHYDKVNVEVDSEGIRYIILGNPDSSGKIQPILKGKEYTLKSGTNVLHYYSRDYANNLEIVKTEEFEVDYTPPKIDVKMVQIPDLNSEPRITDAVVVVEANEPVYCDINVAGCEEFGACEKSFSADTITEDFINERYFDFKTSFDKKFSSLPDGFSYMNVVCTDFAGNVVENFREFIIDADPRIQDPLPRGPVDTSVVTLSVKTIGDVDCRYTEHMGEKFDSISSSRTMSKVWDKSVGLYLHRSEVKLTKDEQYIYYVRCNYDTPALEQVTFTLDRVAPTSVLKSAGYELASDVGWLSEPDVIVACNDTPVGGFGCNASYYCENDMPNLNSLDKVISCDPDILFEDKLPLETPKSVCYKSVENVVNGMGGLESPVKCMNVLVDNTNPEIVINPLPRSVNRNLIGIAGRVYDASYVGDVDFARSSALESFFGGSKFYTGFVVSDGTLEDVGNFDIVTSVDFSELADVMAEEDGVNRGNIGILFQYSSEKSYGVVLFDVYNSKVVLAVKTPKGLEVMDERAVGVNYFSSEKLVRITKATEGYSVNIKNADTSVDSIDLFSANRLIKTLFKGSFGYIIEDYSAYDMFYSAVEDSFKDMTIYFEGEAPYSDLSKKITFKLNDNIKAISDTKSLFKFDKKLTEGIPRHGNLYSVQLFAEDVSGRRSNVIVQDIFYDLSGPVPTSVEFESVIEQNDSKYVEYGYNSNIEIEVFDDYSGISSVFVSIGDYRAEVRELGENLWGGLVLTGTLPAGLHDVVIEAYDGLGNYYRRVFTESLLIDDRIFPLIKFDLKNPYFNTPTPNFNISTDEATKCSVSYTSMNGEKHFKDVSDDFVLTHNVVIDKPLEHENDRQVKNTIIMTCTDANQNKVSRLVDLFIDLRVPVYSIRPDLIDLVPVSLTRHSFDYTAVRDADRKFSMRADEPVMCRFSLEDGFSGDYFDMNDYFISAKNSRYAEGDRTRAIHMGDGYDETYYLQCIDRAGNTGELKRIHISEDKTHVPYLFELPSVVKINLENSIDPLVNTINFYGIRDKLECSYSGSLQGELDYLSESIMKKYSFSIANLSEGNHRIDISCGLSNSGIASVSSVEIIKDLEVPNVEFEGIDMYSVDSALENPVQVNSSMINFGYRASEYIQLKVYNNGVLVYDVSAGSGNVELPLDYGLNLLEIQGIDTAGNKVSYLSYVLSTFKVPKLYLSNMFGGSTFSSYSGGVIVKKDIESNVENLRVQLRLGESGTYQPTLQRTVVNGEDFYAFELSAELLAGLFNIGDLKTYKVSESLVDGGNLGVVELSVYVDGKLMHVESAYYNPLGESIAFDMPLYNTVTERDLENAYLLIVSGVVNRENYIYESVFTYGDNEVDRNLEFELDMGIFDELYDVKKGRVDFSLIGTNDLDVEFGIDSSLFYDASGPDPLISIYPYGDVSYSSRPKFRIIFNEPAMIDYALVTNFTHNFSVGNYNSEELLFMDDIDCIEPLGDEGVYYLVIIVKDENGNAEEHQFEFKYSKAPFQLDLIEPENGYSPVEEFNVVLASDRLALCKYAFSDIDYSAMVYISENLAVDHVIPVTLTNGQERNLFVQCEDYDGLLTQRYNYTIGVDVSAPIIKNLVMTNAEMVNFVPYIVEFPLVGMFNLTLDEESYCRYGLRAGNDDFAAVEEMTPIDCNGVSKCFRDSYKFSVGNLKNKEGYDLKVVCENKAGLMTSSDLYAFQVDLDQGDRVKILSPDEYETDKNINIVAKTNFETVDCGFRFDNATSEVKFKIHSSGNLIHNSSIRLVEGEYELHVRCGINGTDYTKSKKFIVDTSKPKKGSVRAPDNTTSTSRLSAVALNFTDDESGVKYYEYSIGTAPYGKTGWNTVAPWTQTQRASMSVSALNLSIGETYYWSVRVLNRVNLYSDVASSLGTEVLFFDIDDYPEDQCNNGIVDIEEPAVDCGEVCRKACRLGDSCYFDTDCYSPSLICEDRVCVAADSVLDFDDTNVTYDIGDYEVIPTELLEKEVSANVLAESSAWLYWLIAFIVLIAGAGSGYYAYITYGQGETGVQAPGDSNLAGVQSGVAAQKALEEKKKREEFERKQAELKAKKKAALKQALRKKMIDDQKKGQESARDAMFGQFGAESGKTSAEVREKVEKSRETFGGIARKKTETTTDRVAKLKEKLNADHKVGSNFDYHPSGEVVSKQNIQSVHQDVVRGLGASKLAKVDKNRVLALKAKRNKERSASARSALEKFSKPARKKKTGASKIKKK